MILLRRKKSRGRLFAAVLLFAVIGSLVVLWTPFASAAETTGTEDGELLGNVEEILGGLDTGALQDYLDSLTEEQRDFFGDSITDKIMSVISGDFSLDYESALGAIGALIFDGLIGMLPAFCAICAVAILCGLIGNFKSSLNENGTSRIIYFVGYSAILVLLLSSLTSVIGDCTAAVGSMQSQMQAIFPLLLTLIATSGGSVSVAVYQPAVLFLSEIIVSLIAGVIFPLASLICVLHMVGNMSSQVRLRNFSALFGGIIKWVLGVALAAFTVFLTVQGITSATYDGLSFKAAKYAVSNSVPIIGGFLGNGFDLVIAGSVLIKNSVGSCGIILLALVLLPPLIQLVVCKLFMRLSAAVIEPIGETGFTDVLSSLGGAVNYFTAGLLAVGFMYFITLLLLVCSSNTLF